VVVIQSTDTINAGTPGIVIVPLTSKLLEENILRVRVKKNELTALSTDSDALLDQIHTLDRSLLIKELGQLSPEVFQKIKAGIIFLLAEG
jgi:mRNA-degrading endonuclease toxin of MazEF toxin-antitoxin module